MTVTPCERLKAKHEPCSKKYETDGERSGVGSSGVATTEFSDRWYSKEGSRLKNWNGNEAVVCLVTSNGRCGTVWRRVKKLEDWSAKAFLMARSNGPAASCRSHHRRRKTLPKAILCALQTDPSSLSPSPRAFIRIQKPLIVPPVASRSIQLLSLFFVFEATITLFPSACFYSAVFRQSPGLLPRHFHSLIATSSST
jgi:hypothetical protein